MSDDPNEGLIAKLDPDRNYGKNSYDEVVEGIRSGQFLVTAGESLPQLRDGVTGVPMKGTGAFGRAPGTHQERKTWGKSEFSRRAYHDFDSTYASLMKQIRHGNVKAIALWMEYFMGRSEVDSGGALMDQAQMFLDHMKDQAAPTTIEATEVKELDAGP